jgi:hypothetical protein
VWSSKIERRKTALATYLGIPTRQLDRLRLGELEQLEKCKSASAMRLLLGISEKDYDVVDRAVERPRMKDGRWKPSAKQ